MLPRKHLAPNLFWGCLTCLIVVLTSAMGCNTEENEAEDITEEVVSFSDEVVTIRYPKQIEDFLIWETVLDEWEAQTLGQINLVGYESIEELLKNEATNPAPNTILFYPRTAFAEIGLKKRFQPIPESLRGPDDLNLRDLFDALGGAVTEWNGEPAVLPIREPMLLLYYRSDLLEAAGKSPPTSWEEYLELLTTLDEWAPGLTAVEPWAADYRSVSYLTHTLPYVKTSGNYSVFFDYRQGEPLVGSPGFAEGIQQCRKLLPLLVPNSLEMTPADCIDEIREGRAAIAIGSAFNSMRSSRDEADAPVGDYSISAVPIPGATRVFDSGRNSWRELEREVNRVIVTGWDGLSVGVLDAGRDEKNVPAWNALRSILIDYSSNTFLPGYQTSTRLSTSTQIWSPQFSNLNERSHVDAVILSLKESQIVPALIIAHREAFLSEMNIMVNRAVVEASVSPQDALKTLAKQWSLLMEQFGREETLSSYASGLGVTIRKLEPATGPSRLD